ncbi:unnamed protein product [Owenia fusiformis]|uniref:Uncharacterized protein n=1 Tax=Owenia fusiformis TaxID=6347 RepID=A0A8J1UF77_OWEFU|nr:unnamed protein product [Owenia fusiformis]
MENKSINGFFRDDMGSVEMDYSDMLVGLQNDTISYSEDYYDISYRAIHLLGQPDKIVALVVACIALLANIASLLAIKYTYGDLSAHQRLMISLALSDMFISVSVILHIVNHILNPLYHINDENNLRLQSHCARVLIEGLNRTSHVISLMNLMGMAADHYMAILKPLDYHRLMNKKRSRLMILALWLVSAAFGFSDVFSGFAGYDKSYEQQYNYTSNYCEIIRNNNFHPEFAIFALVIVCFIVMSAIYSKIFLIVRSHQRRANEVKENRKAVVTTLLILVTFAVCFLPNTLFQTIMIVLVYYTRGTPSASLSQDKIVWNNLR